MGTAAIPAAGMHGAAQRAASPASSCGPRHRCHPRSAQQFLPVSHFIHLRRSPAAALPGFGAGEEAVGAISRASGARQSPGRAREPQTQPRWPRHGTRPHLSWQSQHKAGHSPSHPAGSALPAEATASPRTDRWMDGCPPPARTPRLRCHLPFLLLHLSPGPYLFIYLLINCCFHNKRSSFSQPPTALGLDC